VIVSLHKKKVPLPFHTCGCTCCNSLIPCWVGKLQLTSQG